MVKLFNNVYVTKKVILKKYKNLSVNLPKFVEFYARIISP